VERGRNVEEIIGGEDLVGREWKKGKGVGRDEVGLEKPVIYVGLVGIEKDDVASAVGDAFLREN